MAGGGNPSQTQYGITWKPTGPCFRSIQGADGILGVDYTKSVDTRWDAVGAVLGPKLTTLDLSGAGGTPSNAVAQAEITVSGTDIAFVVRGTKWCKVKLSDMSILSDGSETALAEAGTDIIYVKNAAGTEELAVGMANTAFRSITAFTTGATDTDSANSNSYKFRKFGYGTPSSVIVGLGKHSTSAENVVASCNLTGTVVPSSGTFSVRSTIAGEEFTFTGFALDGSYWIIGTSNGPYYLDSDFSEFRPLINELDNNTANAVNMSTWFPIGTLIPLADGLRFSKFLSGQSIGPERWPGNRSPVSPYTTAVAASTRWLYTWQRNTRTSESFLLAWRPAIDEDGNPNGNPLTPFCVGYRSEFVGYCRYIGTRGGRTLPTFMAGRGSDALYWGDGRDTCFVDDTAYTYETSGTWYGTEARFANDVEIDGFDAEILDCSSTEYCTLSVTIDGRETIQVGAPTQGYGERNWHRFTLPVNEIMKGRTIKPQVVFAGDGTHTPKLKQLRLLTRQVPLMVDGRYLRTEAV